VEKDRNGKITSNENARALPITVNSTTKSNGNLSIQEKGEKEPLGQLPPPCFVAS